MAALPFLLPMLFQISFAYSPVQSAFLLLPMAISAMAAKPFFAPIAEPIWLSVHFAQQYHPDRPADYGAGFY
jgi:hypothetical protein